MNPKMAELISIDADTSKDLRGMRVFKLSREDKERLAQIYEVTDLQRVFDAYTQHKVVTKAFVDQFVIPHKGFILAKEKLEPFKEAGEGWVTLLRVDLPPLVPPSRPQPEVFETNRQAFLRIKDSLLDNPEYSGKFVAIYGGEIVDQDEDNRELARRVYSEHGYAPIYIGKIERERRVVEMPSPEGL
jgi:hypothetical protein